MMNYTLKIPYKGKCAKLITTSIHVKQYYLNGTYIETVIENVLIDCGSSVTVASKNMFQRLGMTTNEISEIILSNAMSQNMSQISTSCKCNIIIDNIEITNCEILLFEDDISIQYNMILGWDVLREIMINNGLEIFGINNILINESEKLSAEYKDDEHFFIVENVMMHKYCNLQCDNFCDQKMTADTLSMYQMSKFILKTKNESFYLRKRWILLKFFHLTI